jgi:glycosyltransferase involved in cell wall biosynthesis
MLLSILIPTLESRKEEFHRLYEKLSNQIIGNSLADEVEILYLLDNREYSLGFKRNRLIEKAIGRFVAFIDDDDDVSDN